MEEKNVGGDIVIRSPFFKKLENFWYHYKWQSLIALFLVLVLVVCSVQMCTREEYDLHVLYAGQKDVKKTASDGLSEYRVLLSSLKTVTEDYDENGEVTPNLQTLFLPSADEIEKINASLPDGYEVQTQIVIENGDQLEGLMIMSDYYLCFLSEANYLAYRSRSKNFFASLTPYVGESDVEFYTGATDAVYLKSTSFGKLPGWDSLGDEIVICLRNRSELTVRADKKGSQRQFERAEKTLKNIFAETNS